MPALLLKNAFVPYYGEEKEINYILFYLIEINMQTRKLSSVSPSSLIKKVDIVSPE